MKAQLKAGANGPSAEGLGRLLVIQQAVEAIPDELRMADFVRRALAGLPGIADVFLHIEGVTFPEPELAALIQRCRTEIPEDPTQNTQRQLEAGIQCFPMDSPGQHLGCLVIYVADEPALRPYLPFLSNISSAIHRIIVGRRDQARLAQLNEELRAARDHLEMRVAERTRELEYRATHDPVTGLANRALLIDRLRNAISNAARDGNMVAVVYLDLDSFSFMNTGFGNDCGDAFLCETARRLCRLVRESDTVARIGSDEFVILLAGLENVERSSVRLSAMLAAVREPMPLAGKDVVVTASIGACVYPLDGADAELLLRRANTAMHRAKASGKDNIQFYASTRDAAVAERMELETELRRAIPAGELVVYYQPKLDVETNTFIGAEALVRWQHPKRGLLQPGQFVPIAEDSSLIVALGEYVLRQACLQARLWQEAGLGGRTVAVNVAARQLRDGRLVEAVKEVLRDTGLAPACLELEITESSIMHDLDHATALLHELKGLGVSISIDDFGTGYSSLSALRNFPADKLKIDRSFVHEIETVPSAAAVALAVISFARTLGMRVNAEGVETLGQAQCLRKHHCDEIQGFLLARPVPSDEVQALFRQPGLASWDAS
ncbi:putative bifunctional diguanylate cyclase/phosphodiesterase [Massilia litorea]|uniref:EAL domain-containing protein n=1 Tax=Massilia litorea TaxID=2769491 RepID=A0A7L9U477_9BURK|nr:EAL domain-containing protein [Massilia litorea]QOL48836.1 EAL domain-containing protein [Massilia litorea]